MTCMYTAQGEFICKPNIEKYVNNKYNCHGIPVNSIANCDTCLKVKNVFAEAKLPFNPRKINKCSTPLGSWRKTCRSGSIDASSGVFSADCGPRTKIDLFTCPTGKLKNVNGNLQCE